MGDWDRFKNYISDYLEGNLDNSTRKEFEQEIDKNSNLQKLTRGVENLSKVLGDLPEYECSDDFNVKLRDRIHRDSSAVKLPVIPLKKYSFAFSFVMIAVIAVFTFNTLTEKDDPVINLPESSNIQSVQPNPVYQNKMQPASQVQTDNRQVDIKTIDENVTVTDSLHNETIKKEKQSNIKYVDETKK